MRVLTVRQPWADLIMAGVKDVENRTKPVPSTLPQSVFCQTVQPRPAQLLAGMRGSFTYQWAIHSG